MRSRRWRHGVPVGERGPGESYRPETSSALHQPGIATAPLDHVAFAACDVTASRAELRDLLATFAAETEKGDPGFTVTIGLGPAIFERGRFGLEDKRPVALRELPGFPGDALDPAWCGGDVCLQVCGAEPPGAALDALLAHPALRLRWRQDASVRRAPVDRPGDRPRNLLGFKDGTGNLRRGKDLDRHVWIAAGDRTWMRGGTYLVVRRIEVDLAAWEALPVAEQERVIGRRRDSGAPLGGEHEFERIASATVPADAHARVAAPDANGGAALLRRSYSYETGMLLLLYQRDPRRQFVPIQRRLGAHDALSRFTSAVGSAVFAVPPRAFPTNLIEKMLYPPPGHGDRPAPAPLARRPPGPAGEPIGPAEAAPRRPRLAAGAGG